MDELIVKSGINVLVVVLEVVLVELEVLVVVAASKVNVAIAESPVDPVAVTG